MIEINKLSFQYAGATMPALDGVTLHIESGDLFGLLGPNGAGKTTLLSLLTGLRQCDSGNILYNGKNIQTHTKQCQSEIAWVPQEYAFYPVMTITENLRFFGQTLGIKGQALKERIDEVIRLTGLENAIGKRCETFSGGMKRRLNVAIGLLKKPNYLFLDEPTVGIDPQSRHFILEAIKNINANGTTVIYSSHYMEEVQYLCNTIAIIDNGKVLTQGSLQTLLNAQSDQPSHATHYYQLETLAPESLIIEDGFDLNTDRTQLLVNTLNADALARQFQALAQANVKIASMHSAKNNLEHLFLQLTQRSLRD